jgi:hypothetical protein
LVERKKVAASPTREDFVKEFGADKVKDEADGSWTCTVREPQDVKKAFQMQQGVRDIDVERGRELKAKWDGKREKVVHKDGRVVEYMQENIDQIKHKVHAVGRNKMGRALHFGMSEATRKYVRGMDEMDFIWNDGWEPAPLFYRGGAERQRDPDGGVWLKVDGEWEKEV